MPAPGNSPNRSALALYSPDLVESTLDLYRGERPSSLPFTTASRTLSAKIAPIRNEFSMPFLLPHKVFARFLPAHDALGLFIS